MVLLIKSDFFKVFFYLNLKGFKYGKFFFGDLFRVKSNIGCI